MTESKFCEYFFCNMPKGHAGDHNPHHDWSKPVASDLDIQCPSCGAAAGDRCQNLPSDRLLVGSHRARRVEHGQTAIGTRCVNDRSER